MIPFDFSKCGLTEKEITALSAEAERAHQVLLKERQAGAVGIWDLPFDEKTLVKTRNVATEVRGRFQTLLVLGIGGSSVGLRALSRALWPADNHLRLMIQESPDPASVEKIARALDWKKTCINVISKTGNTIETLTLFEHFLDILKQNVGKNWQEQVVVTTEEGDGKLCRFAREENLIHFSVPKNIGGRYSVLSSVGLFPLACIGVDTQRLLKGGRMAVENCSVPDLDKNMAYRNGVVHYLLDKNHGKTISAMMIYSDLLRDLGLWYAQLWAECLGKEGKGQTPLACQGPQDQHSLAQLFLDGPKDKVVTFIKIAPKKGDRFSDLMEREQRATAQALGESGCPSVTITLPEINEETLGELLMTYQIQTAFTGRLMRINPYDQPAVDRIKRLI